jgi:hypothetical protein
MAQHTEHHEITHEIELDDKEFKKLRNIVMSWKREKFDQMPDDHYDEVAIELFNLFGESEGDEGSPEDDWGSTLHQR